MFNSFAAGGQGRRSTISRMNNLQRKSTLQKKEVDYFLDTIHVKGFAKVSFDHLLAKSNPLFP